LIAKAEVLAEAVKGKPGDYAYRAKTGHFELLPNRISIDDLKKKFPRWAWLRQPRGKAIVPAQYAAALWKLVHEKNSTVQILIGGSRGMKLLEQMAAHGRRASWYAPKLTATGDTVLFYIEKPVSAIVAKGTALSRTKPTRLKWYETKVGRVRLLESPITLSELRQLFPNWAWLRSPNQFAYVSPERAKALLKRCELKSPPSIIEGAASSGAGFGDAKTNALVEQAAVRKVTRRLERRGYKVFSRESERVGYDLDATKGRTELHVEVKGVSGEGMQFLITQAEVAKATSDSAFRLMVVTKARTRDAQVKEFRGGDLKRRFALTPVSYFAVRR
jgi:predicted transcriptional regulator